MLLYQSQWENSFMTQERNIFSGHSYAIIHDEIEIKKKDRKVLDEY